MTKEIPLTQGKVALVDDEDYEKIISMGNWLFISNRKGSGYAAKNRCRQDKRIGLPSVILMHREIVNAPIGVEVDHKDRDKLNNTKNNLRLATSSQQKQNMGIRRDNTSGYRGVYWDCSRNKWGVDIILENKKIHIGRFDDKNDAALAYNKKAIELFGEYAFLNELSED